MPVHCQASGRRSPPFTESHRQGALYPEDALPVREQTGLPYASVVEQEYHGRMMPVMHACDHDAHVAILMAVAENLAAHRDQLQGSVKFIFRPAEEGPSDYVYDGERHFGARLMVEQGVLENPQVEAIFGFHVTSAAPTGVIGYRGGPIMAASGDLRIRERGEQTHGAQPWSGIALAQTLLLRCSRKQEWQQQTATP